MSGRLSHLVVNSDEPGEKVRWMKCKLVGREVVSVWSTGRRGRRREVVVRRPSKEVIRVGLKRVTRAGMFLRETWTTVFSIAGW